jgi:hypothetical protein
MVRITSHLNQCLLALTFAIFFLMAIPAVPAGDTPQSAQPPVLPAGTILLKQIVVPDPMINNEPAGTILVPQGWTFDGKIFWCWNPYNRVSLWATITSPQGVGLVTYPSLSYHVPFMGFPQGSKYLGWSVFPRMSPQQYIQNIVIPLARPDLRNAKVLDTQPSPDFANQCVARHGGNLTGEAIRVRFEYPSSALNSAQNAGPDSNSNSAANSTTIEEDLYCGIVVSPQDQDFWTADARSFRAPKGQLAGSMGLLQTILASQRANLRWAVAVQQLNQQLIQNWTQQSNAWLATSMHNAMDEQQISADIQQSYNERAAVQSRAMYEFSQATLGRDTYVTSTGVKVDIADGYDHYLTDASGNVLLTKGVPNNQIPPGWSEMDVAKN